MLRSSAFLIDDLACEWHAIAALRLASERTIGLASARRAAARGRSYIAFTKGIAHAHDH